MTKRAPKAGGIRREQEFDRRIGRAVNEIADRDLAALAKFVQHNLPVNVRAESDDFAIVAEAEPLRARRELGEDDANWPSIA